MLIGRFCKLKQGDNFHICSYGRAIHGPLDVLVLAWEADKKLDESVVSHKAVVDHERDKMEKMMERVWANLGKAQEKQKKWYDSEKAWQRESEFRNQVLVLFPTSNSK